MPKRNCKGRSPLELPSRTQVDRGNPWSQMRAREKGGNPWVDVDQLMADVGKNEGNPREFHPNIDIAATIGEGSLSQFRVIATFRHRPVAKMELGMCHPSVDF